MNESTKYMLDEIKMHVWSGFDSVDDVNELIEDMLSDDSEVVDEALLRAAVATEFKQKLATETTWPTVTDCDRLDAAFEALNKNGVIALHNAGVTQSDGLSDVGEALRERGKNSVTGYCFYHWQDVERATKGLGLWLAFGDLDDDKSKKINIGKVIKKTLETNALIVEWNGAPDIRLHIPELVWRRRSLR